MFVQKYAKCSILFRPGWGLSGRHRRQSGSGRGLRLQARRPPLEWSQTARLLDDLGAANANFGVSVAFNYVGDVAVVGAYQDDSYGRTNQGAAVLYRYSNDAWVQSARFTPGTNGDRFGVSVSLDGSGDIFLGGADETDVLGSLDQGAAYLWRYSQSAGWDLPFMFTGSGASDGRFGQSLSLSDDGNTAIIGAYNLGVGGHIGQGAAYIFTRSALGVWSQQARLTAGDGAAADYFGAAVAISGDGLTALVGAPNADIGANGQQGAVNFFTW